MTLFLIQLSIYVTNAFSPEVILLFCVFILSWSAVYLNVKGIRYREVLSVNCPNGIKSAVLISMSVFTATVLATSIKYIFKIQRPENMLVLENGYSFPSAHASLAFALCASAIFVLFKYYENHNRKYVNYLHAVLFISIATLVSFTRLVLQVHRPIDIIAGCAIGLLSSYVSINMYYTITKYVDFKFFK